MSKNMLAAVLCSAIIFLLVSLPPQEKLPSERQTTNLVTLKNVKKNDLVICSSKKYEKAEISFAFLVEENNGTHMTGYYPNMYSLSRSDGESFSLMAAWDCEMRIYRPSETRIAAEMLQAIILYGQHATPVL